MKQLSGKVTLIVTLLLPLLACSQGSAPGAPAAAAVDDSPEGQAFQYRVGLMHAVAWKVGKLRAMAMGEIPVDDAAAVKNARDAAALAGMMPEGFIPNSAVKGSAALPEIWTNFSDFEAKAADLQKAASALADAAQANGFEASKGMVQAVGQSCGGCHRPYRRREE
jgi:cytochrome c556